MNGRILLVGRRDDDSLPAWWLDITAAADGKIEVKLSPGPAIDFTSQVPVDFDLDPASGHLVMASAAKNPGGREQCLRIAWFEIAADGSLNKLEQRWAGGESSGWNCTTRPVVRFTDSGELYIFHTGWPDGEGQMTAWRTKQIANRSLADGWLLCMLYDIWTRTRRPVAFETGPQGAVYAFRWDSGQAAYDNNDLLIGHNGLGIDEQPMRDHDDGARISLWGIRHSILNMRREK